MLSYPTLLRTVLKTSAGVTICTEFNQRQLKRKKKGSRKFRQIQHKIALHHEYFASVNPNRTSQTCPLCQTRTGKKELSERVHRCQTCGCETNRDVAAAQVVLQRGYTAVGQIAVNFGEGKVHE